MTSGTRDGLLRPRPSFLFIGSSKSGSSWFFEILREHPQVFVPSNKATFFFSDYYARGFAWYEAFFVKAHPESVTGEVCHDYLASPEALRRIRDYQPDMRLVCCLRNPYARALSAWRFFGRNGMDRPTLAAQDESDPSVFNHGFYATQLSVLYSIFPKEQVLIFFFEELSAAPETIAHRLFEFIGVNPDFLPPSLYKRVNVNAKPRSRVVARLVQYVHNQSWKHSHYLSNLIGRIKQIRPLRRFVRATLYKETVSSSDWHEHLRDFPDDIVSRYELEISTLEHMLGKDLKEWHARPIPPLDPARMASLSSDLRSQSEKPPADTVMSEMPDAKLTARPNPGGANLPSRTTDLPLTIPYEG